MEMEEFKPTTDEHMGNLDVDDAAFNAYVDGPFYLGDT